MLSLSLRLYGNSTLSLSRFVCMLLHCWLLAGCIRDGGLWCSYLWNAAALVVKLTPVRYGSRYPTGHRRPIFISKLHGNRSSTVCAFNFEKSLKTTAHFNGARAQHPLLSSLLYAQWFWFSNQLPPPSPHPCTTMYMSVSRRCSSTQNRFKCLFVFSVIVSALYTLFYSVFLYNVREKNDFKIIFYLQRSFFNEIRSGVCL